MVVEHRRKRAVVPSHKHHVGEDEDTQPYPRAKERFISKQWSLAGDVARKRTVAAVQPRSTYKRWTILNVDEEAT